MTNEDISQNPEKLRALSLERGERIERLEVALSHARHALILWTDDPHGGLRDSAIEFADEALADDGTGEPPCPKHTKGNGPCYCQPPDNTPNRDALEALNAEIRYLDQKAARSVAAKSTSAAGTAEVAVGCFAEVHASELRKIRETVRRALTAPPTVPEAVREALEDIARGPLQGPGDFGVYAQATAEKALAQHSEPENDDAD